MTTIKIRRFLIAVGILGVAISSAETPVYAESNCDLPTLLDGVKSSIANGPVGRTRGITIVRIDDPEEGEGVKSSGGRTVLLLCHAHAVFNNAEEYWIFYNLESTSDGKFYISSEIGDFYHAGKTTRSKPPKP
jgi:hypothetical protein